MTIVSTRQERTETLVREAEREPTDAEIEAAGHVIGHSDGCPVTWPAHTLNRPHEDACRCRVFLVARYANRVAASLVSAVLERLMEPEAVGAAADAIRECPSEWDTQIHPGDRVDLARAALAAAREAARR